MRAIVQRVVKATVVDRDSDHVGEIGSGLALLVGVHRNDTEVEAQKLAQKIAHLRIFNDSAGKMNLSMLDLPGTDALAISNFTVYGETKKSRRPSFVESASFDQGSELFDRFVFHLRSWGFSVPTGVFGADMLVSIENDGPVTIVVDVDAIVAVAE